MENSDQSALGSLFEEAQKELETIGFINQVKNPEKLEVTGVEQLSLTESIGAFFKEFATATDRKVASLSPSAHTVDVNKLRGVLKTRDTKFVKNTGVGITIPANFTPGIASMTAHVNGVVEGVFLISCLKTEAVRLYDWLKQIVKNGRPDTNFRWSITNFDTAIDKATRFVKMLPDENRRLKAPLGEVYVNFDEMFAVCERFNMVVKQLGARDIEIAAKELANAYSMGQLLIEKVKSNELVFDKLVVVNLEIVVNGFIELTNLCGAMMTLLNELSAVLREQINEVSKL